MNEARPAAGSKEDETGRARSLRALEGLCRQHTARAVVVEGDPISKARPRFSSGPKGFHRLVYTPKKTIDGERRIAASLSGIEKFKSNVAVVAIFFRATRQRIDVDNMLKAVLDGGTRAGIWNDDSQVTAIIGIIEHDPVRPRTVIALGEHVTTLTRGDAAMVACQACGAKFFPGGRRREKARWCSRSCMDRLAIPIPCARCATPFKKRTNGKFCSLTCRSQARSDIAAIERAKRTHCRRGHELTAENTYHLPGGMSRCHACQAAAARAYRKEGS